MAVRKLIVELIGDSSSLERAFGRTSRSAAKTKRDLSAMERGVVAGSGAFKGLGRSIAFASGGFLAFSGATAFLRKSVDAALEAQVANRQLATQLRNNGDAFAAYRGEIDHTVNRLSALAGIQNDELKVGLTTILRTVPNVRKALRDLGTAADLARAKHLDLNQAALIIAKTEAGNTTLLRRQGFQIGKNATAEQALAKLRAVVAGQARAGTTEQERFGAILHDTEEIIGAGLLPTINKYLAAGSQWLEQMNESGTLQKNVADTAKTFAGVIDDLASAIKAVDKVTGSFKNTLELLLGLKVASVAARWASSFGLFAGKAATAEGEAATLGTTLRGLNLIRFGPLTVAIGGLLFLFEQLRKDAKETKTIGDVVGTAQQQVIERNGQFFRTQRTASRGLGAFSLRRITPTEAGTLTDQPSGVNLAVEAAAKATAGRAKILAQQINDQIDAAVKRHASARAIQLRNTFFDNALATVLTRGGLGDMNHQLAALKVAEEMLRKQLAVVKDITRTRTLTTQLLEVQSQESGVRQQLRDQAKQAREDAAAEAKRLRDLRNERESTRLFGILGLGPGGEARTPNVAKLKGEVASLSKQIAGTVFDTLANERKLASLRKLVADKALPGHSEVRQKAQEMIDAFAEGLKSATSLPRFRHATADALLKGLGLDPTTTRILRARLAQVGPGGSVPAGASLAFAGAGAGREVVVHSNVYLDGRQVTRTVTRGQQKDSTRRTQSRRGPYAGRH